jgi:membrane-associated protease RseP (regulator of RpoE activity)
MEVEFLERCKVPPMPHPFLMFVALMAICQVVNLFGRLLVAWLVGAKVEEVGLFFGPKFLRFCIRGTHWKIGLIPFGNLVRFVDDGKNPNDFSALPLGKRLALYASGYLALAVLACLCLGPRHGIASIWRGCDQILQGAFSPTTYGRTLIRDLYSLLRHDPFVAGLGVVAAKSVALNMYPSPPLDGGFILFALLERTVGVSEKAREWASLAGTLLYAILMSSWLFAVVQEAIGS